MELKTKVNAQDGKQDLTITREFDLPLDLLFKAHADAEIVAQVMGTKVLKFESKKHGGYQFETKDASGNVLFKANGTFHEVTPEKKIIRTFEMENAPFGVQLEVYEFEKLTDQTSKLDIHVIYESGVLRDALLKMPFAQGLNYAHNRLENLLKTSK
jgi:uncharacterized protein YndB with AHSA1/START domain